MTGDQLRMARALLRLGVRELAAASGADKMAILRMEAGRKPHAATLQKIKTALEARGIIFIGAVEPFHEATVAMRFGMPSPAAKDDSEMDDEEDGGAVDQAKAWDEVDFALGTEQIEGMRAYWLQPGRWARLSDEGKKTLTDFMGSDPLQ